MQKYWPKYGTFWAVAVLAVGAWATLPGVVWGQVPEGAESIPSQPNAQPEYLGVEESVLGHIHHGGCQCVDCLSRVTGDYPTLGMQRVPVALFEIDAAQPANVFRIRFDAAYDHERPDRAEYFWARTQDGKGPDSAERNVDYQEIRFYLERRTERSSAFTEIPLRVLDPEVNPNTTGLSDINFGVKSILFEGEQYQLTSIFRTYILSGLDRRGLGTGHVSMEPGILGNYRLSDYTYLHGEFKFFFPIAGDSDFSGEVLRYGVGLSHVWSESSSLGCTLIPTIELVGWSVLDGMETTPTGTAVDIDPEGILNVQPGLRIVFGESFELGISGAFAISGNHWYEELLRLDLRWFF